MLLSVISVLLVIVPVASSAAPRKSTPESRLYGWELEFTNSKLSNSDEGPLSAQANNANDAARERWIEVIRKICNERGDCRIRAIEDWVSWRTGYRENVWSWEVASYRVIYNDGFWYQLSYDPGVVEVQVKPSSAPLLREQMGRLQHDLFDTAARVGLRPKRWAENHLHTGAEAAWGLNLKLIRNFLVDGVNHPELSYLFAMGLHNAPPLISLPPGKHKAFAEIVAAVDSGEIKTLDEFVQKVRRRVYNDTLDYDFMVTDWEGPQKYQQWNIERLKRKYKKGERTIENRAMPSPRSARDVADLTELLDARIEYLLAKGEKPIPLLPRPEELPRAEQVRRFKAYVEEAGLSMRRYRRFLKPSCERYLTRAKVG
jgi:hypothetical protein